MTDRIDLDERVEEESDEDPPNPGDWVWRDVDPPSATEATDTRSDSSDSTGRSDSASADANDRMGDEETGELGSGAGRIPRVPRENESSPVGIPVDKGGAGGSPVGERNSPSGGTGPDHDDRVGQTTETGTRSASGGEPGGGADEMTMALTFRALKRLASPAGAITEARTWTDWIGVVGDVDTPTISKFQRDEQIDLDFFNGAGTDPEERLAEIGPHSMFFSERMVVVGLPGRDEEIAHRANWEFVPLEEAASKADWRLVDE